MTTPSLPASGHGEVAGLVEELVRAVSLRCHSHPGPERRSATERADAAKADLLNALAAAPTPSPVEARADGVREAISEDRLRWIIRQAVVESGPIGGADSAAKEILAALESTPAQQMEADTRPDWRDAFMRYRDSDYPKNIREAFVHGWEQRGNIR